MKNTTYIHKEADTKITTPISHHTEDVDCRSDRVERTVEKNNGLNKNRRGKNMKKFCMMMIVAILMCFILTGCLRQDRNHASVGLKLSNGVACVAESYNGAGMTLSGQQIALKHVSNIVLEEGETAELTFKCNACGNNQKYEIDAPWAEILSCDCPEKIDKNGNAKEYLAIGFSYSKSKEE